jgi:ATP-binding cassette subfamily F protein 3
VITLKNITLRRGGKVLLQSARVVVQPGEKVGLVGRNGEGKSTLLAMLSGVLHEDAGELALPPQWRIAQVAQNLPETGMGASDFVLTGDKRLPQLNAQLLKAEQASDGMAMAQALILRLGFGVNQLDRPVNSFSGG